MQSSREDVPGSVYDHVHNHDHNIVHNHDHDHNTHSHDHGHSKHHSVDIEQETKPAAVDREVHQHHHKIHVQPITDKIVEEERHYHRTTPVERRTRHHGKDREIASALAHEQSCFKNRREVLPVETTNSSNVVVGEHVYHHIHNVIQPVIERQRVVPHIVHTTVPIHERIEHEPHIHAGTVLPAMTLDEFLKKGYSLDGFRLPAEHVDYGAETPPPAAAATHGLDRGGGGSSASHAAGGSYTHLGKAGSYRRRDRRQSAGSSPEADRESRMPRSLSSKKGKERESGRKTENEKEKKSPSPRKHSWLHRLNPRHSEGAQNSPVRTP
ncbi:hypothetical protein DRE_07502 [Drechslerella stenobrocha 248]|uniref:Allergen n=1 Tax=Drechslerella stenobrocha 248 TaxID=1043628 RepID=W7HTX3_9PEZI|nr:hypothetical protein DRE_07502 [Drechslerella stenobrocha 248]